MSKILIVEDEEAIADLEKDYLELSGFDVEIENDGTSGMERALNEDFDMFILDLMLPGTDGFEICRKIREKKNTPANSFVVNCFSSSLTHTRRAVLSIRMPRISMISFFCAVLPIRRSYRARCAFTRATSSLGENGFVI